MIDPATLAEWEREEPIWSQVHGSEAQHLMEVWGYLRKAIAEIRRLREELKNHIDSKGNSLCEQAFKNVAADLAAHQAVVRELAEIVLACDDEAVSFELTGHKGQTRRGVVGLGVGGHHRPFRGQTDDWLTPPEILNALGPFDLDPCASSARPWPTARIHYAPPQNGLALPWTGSVWLNPPYGPLTGKWLARLADYGNGIALTFARTETAFFHDTIWERASACLFLRGRLYFYSAAGRRAPHNAGGPSVLVAYGEDHAKRLKQSGLTGAYVRLR